MEYSAHGRTVEKGVDPGLLRLRSKRIWNGLSDDYFSGSVSVHQGLIVRVEPEVGGEATATSQVIDYGDDVIMPALIDCHVHLVWAGGGDPASVVAAEGEHATVLRAAAHARSQVLGGVQAVRDLGGNWDVAISVAEGVRSGTVEGPEVVASGRTIIMTGGHDEFWGIAADGIGPCVAAVRRQWRRGARVIKIAASGGVYGQALGEEIGQAQLTLEEMSAVVVEAHRLGLRVAAHAVGSIGVKDAVLAGVDTIEHGAYLTEEICERMMERHTYLCPTALVYERIADGKDDVPMYARLKAGAVVERQAASIAMAQEYGVPIIAGTDAGSCRMPHPCIVDELATLSRKGVRTLDVLKAGTSRAAEALGIDEVTGTIAVGQRASVIVVGGDPLADVGALSKVRSFWCRGIRIV